MPLNSFSQLIDFYATKLASIAMILNTAAAWVAGYYMENKCFKVFMGTAPSQLLASYVFKLPVLQISGCG